MSGSNGAIIGAPNLRLIDSIVQFSNGTQAVWNTITVPIPLGLVVYAVDTTVVKMGDGITLYQNLPILFTLNSIVAIYDAFVNNQIGGGGGGVTMTQVNNAIAEALTDYVTQAQLTAALSNYTTTSSLTALLNNYATKAWTTTAIEDALSGFRIRLTANTTFYINGTTGSDATGNGSEAAPWATVANAYSVIFSNYDLSGYTITLNYNGASLVIANNMMGALWYTFDESAPPTSDINLNPGDKLTITFENVTTIPLCVATTQGIYKITSVITTTNTVNSDWYLMPNNTTYGDAFSSWGIENQDELIASIDYSGGGINWAQNNISPFNSDVSIPRTYVQFNTKSCFFFDLFYGPNTVDTVNDIGPSIQEFVVSTYTSSKMVKQSSAITGGPASASSIWLDTETAWTSLGTLYDAGGDVNEDTNATVSGTIVIERIA